MKTRVFKIILSVITLISLFALCGGCGCDDAVDIELDYFVYEMDILDDFTLTAKTSANADQIEWTSSDENVATVSAGKVTPISAGETVITAKVGGSAAVCYLTVVNNNRSPILWLSDEKLTLVAGDGYAVKADLKYLGKSVENVSYEFTSLDASVATVDASGVITAVASGKTAIKVYAPWKNLDANLVTAYVDVNVVKDIRFEFNASEYFMYAVAEVNGVAYENTAQVSCVAYENGVDAPIAVALGTENADICEVQGGNTLVGKKTGETRVVATAEYDGYVYSDSVVINVGCALVDNADKLYISKLDSDISHAFKEETEITKVVLYSGSAKTELKVADNKIKGASDLSVGAVRAEVYGDKYAYSFEDAEILDLFITKPEHVEIMRAQTSGKYLLGCDVDMAGVSLGVYANTFTGELDGDGHAIKNLKYTALNTSLFYRLSGTVKNVALTNVTLGVRGSGVQSGAMAVWAQGATVEGVYVSMDFGNSNHSGGLFKHVEAGLTKINNSLVQTTTKTTENSGLLFGFGSSLAEVDLTGTYVIKKQSEATIVGGREQAAYQDFRERVNALDGNPAQITYTMSEFTAAVDGGTLNFGGYSEAVSNCLLLVEILTNYQDDIFG